MDQQADSGNSVNYEDLYQNIIQEMELMHKNNLHKLKIGFGSLFIVPTVFLIMLFFTGSSKTVFLILWIVSMFIIATILVRIEFSDYQLQNRINKATDREGSEAASLIEEGIESNRSAMHELLMREESRLPFRFGGDDRVDDADEGEYDTEGAEIMDSPDLEPQYDEDALAHYDEDYGEEPVTGLSEDDDFIHGSDYDEYDLAGFGSGSGGGAGAQDEPQISVIDDDMDSIDTLLSNEDTPQPESSSEDTPAEEEPEVLAAETQSAEEPEVLTDDTPAEEEPEVLAAETQSAEEPETVMAGVASDSGIAGLDISSIGTDSSDNEDELPANITVDDILTEYHKNELDSDYEADFSAVDDAGIADAGEDDDLLGGLDDDSDA